ncbi:winged helix-turn-helix domain-containing protein [Streptomyces flavidovirens]|uniref:ArsR/SmtB family transcription factor n=1 Tax=Streptomyces flavidovirens TaxID=67298 RepID=UPI00341886BB
MNWEQRIEQLERRVDALEEGTPAASSGPVAHGGELWALDGLKEQAPEDGGVVFAGSVPLPGGERVEWQYGLATGDLLGESWADAVEVFAALGQPVRLMLLREILGGRRTAAELAALDGVGTTGQVYHHLRQLAAAGWLHGTGPGGRGEYEVPLSRVVPLLAMMAAARR